MYMKREEMRRTTNVEVIFYKLSVEFRIFGIISSNCRNKMYFIFKVYFLFTLIHTKRSIMGIYLSKTYLHIKKIKQKKYVGRWKVLLYNSFFCLQQQRRTTITIGITTGTKKGVAKTTNEQI